MVGERLISEWSATRDEGRGTKEAAEEKEEIHIMKPSFCAETPLGSRGNVFFGLTGGGGWGKMRFYVFVCCPGYFFRELRNGGQVKRDRRGTGSGLGEVETSWGKTAGKGGSGLVGGGTLGYSDINRDFG